MQDLYRVIRIRENEELQSVKKRLSLTLMKETVKKSQGWTVLVVTLSVPHGLIFFPSSRKNARCFTKKSFHVVRRRLSGPGRTFSNGLGPFQRVLWFPLPDGCRNYRLT